MMRKLMTGAMACALAVAVLAPAHAGEKAARPQRGTGKSGAKPQPAMQQMVLTGRVTKLEKQRQNKDTGATQAVVRFMLVTEDGTRVSLPSAGPDAEKLAAYVDQTVTVTGLGMERTHKNAKGAEKRVVTLRKIQSIEAAAAGAEEADDAADE